jgi:hypothetical protein
MDARGRLISMLVAALLGVVASAGAQTEPGVALDGVAGAAALRALERECYEAGLTVDASNDPIIDCSAVIEERVVGGASAELDEGAERIVVRHKLRFTLLERAGAEGRIRAEAWTETEELGTVIEQPVTSQEYLRRVDRVLAAVVARLEGNAAPPWAGRFESEQAWHLEAHVRAVSHCDANLARMTAESVAAELATIGLRPTGDDRRDRCEQLYTHLYEWGLARGNAAPTVADYARYRAALPPEQRICSGQLALDASCPF